VVVSLAPELLTLPRAAGVQDRDTSELLAILLDATGVDSSAVDALARAIDSGALRGAATTPEKSSVDYDLPPPAMAALAAAFELTRRAKLHAAPAVIRGPADVAAIARRELGGLCRECVLVVACDAANRPMRALVVAHGSVDHVTMPVREILSAVLGCDGRAFALAHNHPYENPEPSEADVEATERLAKAARVVGLRFLGHVVVTLGTRWARVSEVTRKPGS